MSYHLHGFLNWDELTNQCNIMDSFDDDLAAALGEVYQNSLSPQSNSASSILFLSPPVEAPPPPPPPPQNIGVERPNKKRKNNNYIPNLDQSSSASIILDFGNSNIMQKMAKQVPLDEALSDDAIATKGTKKSSSRVRAPSQSYDHIIAERKRREQLSQRFVALSAIVPGLKKMDKTSVLGDTIKYLKQLQEQVKTLEEQCTNQTMESVVLVKRSQLTVEDEGSSDEHSLSSFDDSLPEIEARACDKSVLLKIHCEKHKGVLVKILSEIEKMNLTVVNSSVAQFGSLALDITIIAEMEKEFDMKVEVIVRNLRSTLRRAK